MFHEKWASIAPFFICSMSLMGINHTLSHWFWPLKMASNSLIPCFSPPLSNLFIHIQDEAPVQTINEGLMLAAWSKAACLLQFVLSWLFFFQSCLWICLHSAFHLSWLLSVHSLYVNLSQCDCLLCEAFVLSLLTYLPTYRTYVFNSVGYQGETLPTRTGTPWKMDCGGTWNSFLWVSGSLANHSS
jgi:hypothetical protein